MKILILGDPGSAHVIKWVKYLCNKSINIYLFGLNEFEEKEYLGIENLKIKSLNMNGEIFKKQDGNFTKLNYLKAFPTIKKIIQEFKPDIMHAHYASSYGLLGALSGFHPYILSVYGSDVFNFPNRNFLTKYLFRFNLRRADKILSTSRIMAKEIRIYTEKEIEVTPFGIDIDFFKPLKVENIFNKDDIVIGTIKSLEKKYGIEYLIRAFKQLKENNYPQKLKLLIVGGGTLEKHLKNLVKELDLWDFTMFTGYIPPKEIPKYHNMLDIYASLSIEASESFGVAVLEASACEKPVVVSNIGGLPEVVINNTTGFLVEKENVNEISRTLERLILNEKLRKELGTNGREFVIKSYNWKNNVESMINIYNNLLK